MNIKQLKEYINDLPDDMEMAYFDCEFCYPILVTSVEVREEQVYKYIKNNLRYEADIKNNLLILE